MALVVSHGTTLADAVNKPVFVSASVSAAAGALVLATIANTGNLTNFRLPAVIANSGAGLIWALLWRVSLVTGVAPSWGLAQYAALAPAAGFTGTVSIDYGATQRACLASFDVVEGVSIAGPVNLANVQPGLAGTGLAPTVSTLPLALADPLNLHCCAVLHGKNEATGGAASYTRVVDVPLVDGVDELRLAVLVKANDRTCGPSWATASPWLIGSSELAVSATLIPDTQPTWRPTWLAEVAIPT